MQSQSKVSLKAALLGALGAAIVLGSANATAAMIISEVNPGGSGSSYGVDWFELTNTGSSTVNITGWKMDDNSFSYANSVALLGATSILAGQSVVFLETSASNFNTVSNNFKSAWFGSNTPTALTLGYYTGSGVGLSTSGDGVIVYNSGGSQMAKVSFGAASAGKTFDNKAGLDNTSINTISAVGINGAFLSNNGTETGSPGVVPVPSAAWLLLSGLGGLGVLGRRKKQS